MEPKLPTPSQSPERGPTNPINIPGERINSPTPELPVDAGRQERSVEQAREQLSGIGAGDAGATYAPPIPQVAVSMPTGTTTQSADDDAPLVAADEDLIEREWVDKAKRIVVATRDDPYAQEREVSKLQANYLQKRYGKEVKVSNQ
ncbi:hypothetical protein TM7_0100 [candidate division TM7 genomosp. GTL1]|nr:hypothetical protein TM7_0100 [candidate division TM7 genomosp. GTL1]